MRKRFSRGRWLLEGKNGTGGGGKGFAEANRESAARYDRAVTVLSSSSLRCVQPVAFHLQFELVVPALLSHIPPSRRRQIWLPRRVIPRLYCKIVIPIFCVSRNSASWVVVGIRRLGATFVGFCNLSRGCRVKKYVKGGYGSKGSAYGNLGRTKKHHLYDSIRLGCRTNYWSLNTGERDILNKQYES
jgi:hypothetical protein